MGVRIAWGARVGLSMRGGGRGGSGSARVRAFRRSLPALRWLGRAGVGLSASPCEPPPSALAPAPRFPPRALPGAVGFRPPFGRLKGFLSNDLVEESERDALLRGDVLLAREHLLDLLERPVRALGDE